ncbi:MAG: hypothetical protein FWC85_04575 [Elusimicrobia bacterium]|nr:hypothetical protein [Elusimicrobiota bacterium]
MTKQNAHTIFMKILAVIISIFFFIAPYAPNMFHLRFHVFDSLALVSALNFAKKCAVRYSLNHYQAHTSPSLGRHSVIRPLIPGILTDLRISEEEALYQEARRLERRLGTAENLRGSRRECRGPARGALMWAIVKAQREHFETYGTYVFTDGFARRSEELGIDTRDFAFFREFKITSLEDSVLVIEIPDPFNQRYHLTLYYPKYGKKFTRGGHTAPFHTLGKDPSSRIHFSGI